MTYTMRKPLTWSYRCSCFNYHRHFAVSNRDRGQEHAASANETVIPIGKRHAERPCHRLLQRTPALVTPHPPAKHGFPVEDSSETGIDHDLDWTPHTRIRVFVQRDGRMVPLQLVREAIIEKLQQDHVADHLDVELTNRRLTLMIPADMPPEVSVDALDYNSQNRRFVAAISVPVGNGKVIRAKAQGEVYPVIDVPVLGRHAAPGETIRASDIVWTKMRAARTTTQ